MNQFAFSCYSRACRWFDNILIKYKTVYQISTSIDKRREDYFATSFLKVGKTKGWNILLGFAILLHVHKDKVDLSFSL